MYSNGELADCKGGYGCAVSGDHSVSARGGGGGDAVDGVDGDGGGGGCRQSLGCIFRH